MHSTSIHPARLSIQTARVKVNAAIDIDGSFSYGAPFPPLVEFLLFRMILISCGYIPHILYAHVYRHTARLGAVLFQLARVMTRNQLTPSGQRRAMAKHREKHFRRHYSTE